LKNILVVNLTYVILALAAFFGPLCWHILSKGNFDINQEIDFMLRHPGYMIFLVCMLLGIVFFLGFIGKFLVATPSRGEENAEDAEA